MEKVVVNNDHKRGILSEGRSHQMGFAFIRKISKTGEFETVQPISPCKDYLNDVVATEMSGVPVSAHGLKYKKKLGFLSNRHKWAYIAFKICGYGSSCKEDTNSMLYSKCEEDKKNLRENIKNFLKILNYIDSLFGFNPSVVMETTTPDLFVVKFDVRWAKSTYAISFYSLLCRVAQYYRGETSERNYLDDMQNPLEKYMWQTAMKFVKDYEKTKKFPEWDVSKENVTSSIHNQGIVNYVSRFIK